MIDNVLERKQLSLRMKITLKSLISAGGFKCRGAIDVKRSTP